jgi:hypothetical protein
LHFFASRLFKRQATTEMSAFHNVLILTANIFQSAGTVLNSWSESGGQQVENLLPALC